MERRAAGTQMSGPLGAALLGLRLGEQTDRHPSIHPSLECTGVRKFVLMRRRVKGWTGEPVDMTTAKHGHLHLQVVCMLRMHNGVKE